MMGNRLQEVLKREGVKPYRLSKDLGIDRAQLSRFLNGKMDMSLKKLEKIAEYLGYDLILAKRSESSKKGEK